MIRIFHKTVILLIIWYPANAQLIKNPKSFISTGAFISTSNQNPFWIRSNQYGIVPLESQVLQVRVGYKTEYDSTRHSEIKRLKKKFDYAFGAELVGNIGNANQFIIPEAYFKTRLGAFEFYAGRRREIVGLVDTLFTSGSYIWSGNALPLPKIEISIPNYTPITKNGLIYIKGGINHGWFGNQGTVKNYFLHQKWLYGRIGNETSKIKLYGGINHQVQWGGITQNTNSFYSNNGILAPYPLYSYQFVLIPFLQKLVKVNTSKVTYFDAGLAIGNHLGSVDIGIELETSNIKLLLYKQQPYDFARSLYNLNNIEDGLYGFSINLKKSRIISKILIEYLYTLSQGLYRFGKYRPSNYTEADRYFAHGQYISWDYNNLIIGTPFILMNENGIYNNRVKVFSMAISGLFTKKLPYFIGGTYSSNFGVYGRAISDDQFSGKVTTLYPLAKNSSLLFQLAFDSGTLYPKNIGLSIIYRKKM